MTRYLLCRPRGGLNDMLVQIEMCWRYAEKHGRSLIIESNVSGLMDDIFKYFDTVQPKIEVIPYNQSIADELDKIKLVVPREIQGRITSYQGTFDRSSRRFVDKESGQPLTFDFRRDYAEQLLVHERWGGGQIGFDCLRRFRLRPEIAAQILDRNSDLGADYVAIHIRNTDLKTDYRPGLNLIRADLVGRNVYFCSDDFETVEYVKEFFAKEVNFFYNNNIDRSHRKKLHYNKKIPRQKSNIETIADLVWLSMSSRLYIWTVETGNLSGFSRLAARLASNKAVLAQIANGAAIGSRHPAFLACNEGAADSTMQAAWEARNAPVWHVQPQQADDTTSWISRPADFT